MPSPAPSRARGPESSSPILGVPLVDLELARFSLPLVSYTTSYFLTARLAARRMVANKSGVIMTVSALHSRMGIPFVGGLRPGAGSQGGTDSRAVRRARPAWHSRGWPATAGHAGDTHDLERLRASRQGDGDDLGPVATDARKQVSMLTRIRVNLDQPAPGRLRPGNWSGWPFTGSQHLAGRKGEDPEFPA